MRTHGRERFGTTRILVRGRPRPHIAMTARIAASNGLSRPRSRPGRLINAVADYSRRSAKVDLGCVDILIYLALCILVIWSPETLDR